MLKIREDKKTILIEELALETMEILTYKTSLTIHPPPPNASGDYSDALGKILFAPPRTKNVFLFPRPSSIESYTQSHQFLCIFFYFLLLHFKTLLYSFTYTIINYPNKKKII